MEKIIIRHEYLALEVTVTEDNTSIKDSYQIKSYSAMKSILEKIRMESSKDMAIHKRSISGMIHEWRAHNMLYSLGIERTRTGTVDLDLHESKWRKTAYFILSPFYFHFY